MGVGVVIKHKGNFKNTERFLKNAQKVKFKSILDKYGKRGVIALSASTPIDSGETANAWTYNIKMSNGSMILSWSNTNVNNGVPIAILLQYGHATKNGGFVQGRDFINPAISPIFDDIAKEAWAEVTKI